MKRFVHVDATSPQDAATQLSKQNAHAMGGGTDLLGLMKDGLIQVDLVVNLKSIPNMDYIKEESGEIRIGANARLADIAASAVVQQKAPALAQAAAAVASPQIRNMGTLGGNLAQKVRCWYFRDPDRSDCYKRAGSYCYAVFGASDLHAIFDGAACFAVHPSDAAVALSALAASIVIQGPNGQRVVGIDAFFMDPHTDYLRETVLDSNEIITEVRIPSSSVGQKSIFLKAAPRKSIDFARGSVAVLLTANPRVTLGAVAPAPRRATDVEAFLAGKKLSAAVIAQALPLAIKGAQPLASNAYKIDLAQGLLRSALTRLMS